MENECKYVSSRGLFKSTDIHNRVAASSRHDLELDEFKKTQRGSVIYVCNSAIRTFVMETLPFITDRFVLVSGDSDNDMPYGSLSTDEFAAFIADKRLQHWFCQNLLITHPKMTHLPIGLDYHTLSKIGEQHPWGLGALPVDQEKELERAIQKLRPLPFGILFVIQISIIVHGVLEIAAIVKRLLLPYQKISYFMTRIIHRGL